MEPRLKRGPRGVTKVIQPSRRQEVVPESGPGVVVGAICVVERRHGFSGSILRTMEKSIVKLTEKRAYLDERMWFSLDDPKRIVRPAYLDYITCVVEVKARDSEPFVVE